MMMLYQVEKNQTESKASTMQPCFMDNAAVGSGSRTGVSPFHPPQSTQFFFGGQQFNQYYPPQFYPGQAQMFGLPGLPQQLCSQSQQSSDPGHQWFLQVWFMNKMCSGW